MREIYSGYVSCSSEDGMGSVYYLLVKPFGWVCLVPLQSAVVGVNASELHILAKIVSTLHAKKTLSTRNAGLYGDSIT